MISLEMDRLFDAKVQRNIIYTTKPGHAFIFEGRPLHGDRRSTVRRSRNADFHLRPDSPAYDLGFEYIDIDRMGLSDTAGVGTSLYK